MNLLEIRTNLVNKSGRFDLVVDTTDYVDNGANFYINEGQKYLDRKASVKGEVARNFSMIATGDCAVIFQNCRVIEEVWCADSEKRLQLRKVDMEKLRGSDYPSGVDAYVKPFGDATAGRPLYYAPANLRATPNQDREGFDIIDGYGGDYMDITLGNSYSYNGIVFFPPADKAYQIEIKGKFLSESLDSDAQVSMWSVEHPHILHMAAMRSMEIDNRNSEGRKDWTAAIDTELLGLEKDLVDEESLAYDVMEG